MVVDACPNIIWVGKGGEIRSWADLMAATLAAIYQRADLIHSAGGYLRNLVTPRQERPVHSLANAYGAVTGKIGWRSGEGRGGVSWMRFAVRLFLRPFD